VRPGFRRHREDSPGHDLAHLHLRCPKIAIGDDPDKPLSLDDRKVADLMGMK
jgi:hypothetical protein